jgi:hypothetical protein
MVGEAGRPPAEAASGRRGVIAHVVLFRPRATLQEAERDTFLDALAAALETISVIKRAHVGRRRLMGRAYDRTAPDFPYAAILEFEDDADLRAYLDHPAHERLGVQFYTASDAALAIDFELIDGARVRELFP